MARLDRIQPHSHLPHREGVPARDEGPSPRDRHRHVVGGCSPPDCALADCVCRRQGRNRTADQGDRAPSRSLRGPGQLHRARDHPHRTQPPADPRADPRDGSGKPIPFDGSGLQTMRSLPRCSSPRRPQPGSAGSRSTSPAAQYSPNQPSRRSARSPTRHVLTRRAGHRPGSSRTGHWQRRPRHARAPGAPGRRPQWIHPRPRANGRLDPPADSTSTLRLPPDAATRIVDGTQPSRASIPAAPSEEPPAPPTCSPTSPRARSSRCASAGAAIGTLGPHQCRTQPRPVRPGRPINRKGTHEDA